MKSRLEKFGEILDSYEGRSYKPAKKQDIVISEDEVKQKASEYETLADQYMAMQQAASAKYKNSQNSNPSPSISLDAVRQLVDKTKEILKQFNNP